eukprot:UC4_evm2s1433
MAAAAALSAPMHLYNLTLQRSTSINAAIIGNFSGKPKQQEIIVARGKILELLRPDPSSGKLSSILVTEVFGIIRSIKAFRLTGGTKDYIVVGSDSGRIVVLEYIADENRFDQCHMETFGKSGCRRLVPGQYLAVDPKGRAIMIGATEKQKLVYIMNRDSAARLTISSPLEAHKAHNIIFDICGLDVGFENPIFACLELDYEESDRDSTGEAAQLATQTITYYELDLGLNHVVRKQVDELDDFANLLVRVPGGNDGPGGVLVCSEGYVTYRNFSDDGRSEAPSVRIAIPKRNHPLEDTRQAPIIVSTAMHKTKSLGFFYLFQTDLGDIFKVTLKYDEDMVTDLTLKYFDTVPTASGICMTRTGLLFVAAEFGDHQLYQISQLGDNEDEPEFTTLNFGQIPWEFSPRDALNIINSDTMQSLAPILCCEIADLGNEDTPQFYAACGRGARSSLRVLRHGLEMTEMAVSELPGNPNAVWTVKRHVDEAYDTFIIVSFVDATLVLSIGESVEEVTDSGFLGTSPTLSASRLGDDALVQIYPEGIRHIKADKRINEWKAPGGRFIQFCAVNDRQVVISIAGDNGSSEITYFELDDTGHLNELNDKMNVPGGVTCLGLPPVPSGLLRSRFLAVGCADSTVRVVSLSPKDCLQPLSMQAMPFKPEYLCVLEMNDGSSSHNQLFLNIGLENGVFLRTMLDATSGDLSDTRTRYLGTKAPRLVRVQVQGNDAVLALSTRPWLSYSWQGQSKLTPVSYETLEHASTFCSEECVEGLVAVAQNTLRILSFDKLGTNFNQVVTDLEYSPRKIALHPPTAMAIVIETEQNVHCDASAAAAAEAVAVKKSDDGDVDMDLEYSGSSLDPPPDPKKFGHPRAGSGNWCSNLRLVDPLGSRTLQKIRLSENEAAFSLAIVNFTAESSKTFVIVGVVKGLHLKPKKKFTACYLNTYLLSPVLDNPDLPCRIEFVHSTPVEDIPGYIVGFQGRLLVGVGNLLRIYDLGKKKLLRKCENRQIPNFIVDIKTMGPRIVVGDTQESFYFLKYRPQENQLVIFADEANPRWTTCSVLLDYNTVAGADKFGNIVVCRLPADVNDDVEEDPTGLRSIWERGMLNGASQKLQCLATFYVGETVHSIQRATLIPGGSESLVYTTLSGSIGVLVPFTSKEDIDFFQHLEMHLRSEVPPICGRDHLWFRSSYFPVKNVTDGDLCESFNSLSSAKKSVIAEELDREVAEVAKKLEDIRNKFAF